MEQSLSVLLSSQSQDWYTPPQYIQAARRVMGGIDLDPASSAQANQIVKATTFYDAAVNGLAQPRKARSLFLNPPYGKQGGTSNQEIWTRKLIEEYRAGVRSRVTGQLLITRGHHGNESEFGVVSYGTTLSDIRKHPPLLATRV